jgi:hypothetical protein
MAAHWVPSGTPAPLQGHVLGNQGMSANQWQHIGRQAVRPPGCRQQLPLPITIGAKIVQLKKT